MEENSDCLHLRGFTFTQKKFRNRKTGLQIAGCLLKSSKTLIVATRLTSSFKWYQILKEPQPCDIHTSKDGIPVIKPPEPTLTEVIESRDPEEWKHVEKLFPRATVPDPPVHTSYPTPSGWFPPKDPLPGELYRVRRTRFHNFPLYKVTLNGGNRHFTVVHKVEGDIKKFDEEVKKYLSKKTNNKIYTTVNEVCCKLWIRGLHLENVSQFLTDKGF
ncbi:hypothetical protein HELRODRAFT_191798 [Helobdella robusta]|uniref:Large ribosomal subunit protein mL49 n=1 Tax=Helobdella robusta TaxID=6412 RepID=T1FTC1_HELRO|nr:hypothetical protein HELRODRAFT_191798 [Helobdella robusta]ESO03919.1 hypothetical protein HELRODRAFT_191798 [Helobdella robusta]